MDKEKIVIDFINENFVPESIVVTDFPLFPAGKKIIDSNGGEMVVFYDLLTNAVKWIYPDKKNNIGGKL